MPCHRPMGMHDILWWLMPLEVRSDHISRLGYRCLQLLAKLHVIRSLLKSEILFGWQYDCFSHMPN